MENQRIQVSASILGADLSVLAQEIKKSEFSGCDQIHVDVMDGHFVPNITIGQVIIQAIRPLTKLPIDAHLMIEHPGDYIDSFIKAGADIISIHAECYGSRKAHALAWNGYPKEIEVLDVSAARKDILRIKGQGKKAFLAVNPGTAFCYESLLKELDGVLVMSVNPGFAGQKFMPEVLEKIKALRAIFDGDITIDGGINDQTAPMAVQAGANILVTASYFFGAPNPKEVVSKLKC